MKLSKADQRDKSQVEERVGSRNVTSVLLERFTFKIVKERTNLKIFLQGKRKRSLKFENGPYLNKY